MENNTLCKATQKDADAIWEILAGAIRRRAEEGSLQWQNGYPNPEIVADDIEKGLGFILKNGEDICAYAALIENNEPAYETIEGSWLNNDPFLVVHRVAVHDNYLGKGSIRRLFKEIENYGRSIGITNIKVDTNFDNGAMLHILETMGYHYCGKIYLQGGERLAYQKKF